MDDPLEPFGPPKEGWPIGKNYELTKSWEPRFGYQAYSRILRNNPEVVLVYLDMESTPNETVDDYIKRILDLKQDGVTRVVE